MKTSLYTSAEAEQQVMAIYEDILKNWPVAHTTQMISTRHGESFVIESGDKSFPPLILLHGAGSNSSMWVAELRDFSQSYRVFAVDLIGEAGKSSPNRPAWDTPAFAE